MKTILYTFILTLAPLFAKADLLVEREMFNARNGESYVCKIHSDMKTELVNEGISVGKFNTELTTTESNFKKWLTELKAQAKGNKFDVETKKISQYTVRGFKRYSVYNGKSKLSFYTLQQAGAAKVKGKKKAKAVLGSVESKVKNDNANVQRLRGQTDEACKKALAKL